MIIEKCINPEYIRLHVSLRPKDRHPQGCNNKVYDNPQCFNYSFFVTDFVCDNFILRLLYSIYGICINLRMVFLIRIQLFTKGVYFMFDRTSRWESIYVY